MDESMRIITKVERQKQQKSRYNIYVEDEFAFSVHEDLLVKYRLLKGELLDEERIRALTEEDESNRVYADALRRIGRRPMSEKELVLRLKEKGHEAARVAATIDRLKEQGYLNDGHFAHALVENRLQLQGKGKRWIQQELKMKGVAESDIRGALDTVDPKAELESAARIGIKKWRTLSGEAGERKRKLFAFLARRGFSAGIITQVFAELQVQPGGEEELPTDDWEEL